MNIPKVDSVFVSGLRNRLGIRVRIEIGFISETRWKLTWCLSGRLKQILIQCGYRNDLFLVRGVEIVLFFECESTITWF